MTSKQNTVDFVLEQIAGAGSVSAKKMFGEYGLFCDGKLFGLLCDDQLFIKPTLTGRALLGADVVEASPYPGAKPCFVIAGEIWDDAGRLTELVRRTTADLPLPKPRSKRRAKSPQPGT